MTSEIEEIYLGNYTQDTSGQWWKMFPDGKRVVSEEISDLLNFHKSTIQQKQEEYLDEFVEWFLLVNKIWKFNDVDEFRHNAKQFKETKK